MKYIYTILTLLLVIAIGYLSFGTNNKSAKAQRIACQKKSIVFEKLYDTSLLTQVQNTVKSGAYKLTSRVLKSEYMKTKMFEYVDIKEVDKLVEKAIAKHQISPSKTEDKVAIDYYIYENDKADPGKKTVKSKLYAGYLRFTFTYKGKRIYSVQVDFMDLKGKDIAQSVECAIKSLVTL